jgi:hypothetical protein
MRLIPRLGRRRIHSCTTRRPTRRPAAPLRLTPLEDRTLPSFGFGWAFDAGHGGGRGVALDGGGNLYVAGYVITANGTTDATIAKYSAADESLLWSTDLGSGIGYQVAVSGSGVYVSGPFTYAGVSKAVAQLDPATGTVLHTAPSQAVNGSYSSSSLGVAVGPSTGTVYVYGNASASQVVVAQLDASLDLLWTRTTAGTGTAQTAVGGGQGVAVYDAPNGGPESVYVTGSYSGTTAFGTVTKASSSQDAFVWKLNADGSTAAATGLGSTSGGVGAGIAVDAAGNAYVTGNWNGYPGATIFVAKLTPALAVSWNKFFTGQKVRGSTGSGAGLAAAVDAAGNVYTTGLFIGSFNFNPGGSNVLQSGNGGKWTDIYVSELDAGGNFVAVADFRTTSASSYFMSTRGAGIAVDASSPGSPNVYTAGGFNGSMDFDPTAGTYTLASPSGVNAFVSKLTQTSPQLAVGRGPNVGVVPLTQAQLNAAKAAAIREWAAAGLPAADLARMRAVRADVVAIGGNHLGAAELNGTEIALDATADGWGWSVNPTAKPAAGGMDLVTVVAHDMGHVVGLDSRFTGDSHDLMYAYLSPGERRLLGPADGVAGVHPAAPTASAEDRIAWLATAALLKPKTDLYADWLSAAGDAIN